MKKFFVICVTILFVFCFDNLSYAFAKDKNNDYIVAIIDSGVDYTHPDIKDNMWENKTKLDGKYGYDFVNNDNDPKDDSGSGTHCAGIILNEIKKYKSIDKIKIMALKCIDNHGRGKVDDIIKAYEYVIKAKKSGENIVAILNSYEGKENPKKLEDKIKEAGNLGIMTVCSAGDNASDLDKTKTFPACYHLPTNLVVSSVTKQGVLASFSSYGKYSSDIGVLGEGITSASIEDAYIPNISDKNYMFYTFENDEPFDNITSTDVLDVVNEEYYDGQQSLKWSIGSTKTKKNYIEGKSIDNYTNVLNMKIDENILTENEEDIYFGLSYKVKTQTKNLSTCYINVCKNGQWYNISNFMIQDINNWNDVHFKLDKDVTDVRIICTGVIDKTFIYIDNIGIGPSTGKYVKKNGTKQSAAICTAEVVYLLDKYPDEKLEKIKSRIIGGADKTIKGYVVSDGTINIDNSIKSPNPVIYDTFYEDGKVVFTGYFLGNNSGSLQIGNDKIDIDKWTNEYIKVNDGKIDSGSSLINVKTHENHELSQIVVVKKQTPQIYEKKSMPIELKDAATVEIGGYIYVMAGIKEDGRISNHLYRYNSYKNYWDELSEIPEKYLKSIYMYDTSAVEYEENILFVAFDNKNDKNIYLIYDMRENKWSEANFIKTPEARIGMKLVKLNTSIYAIGGFPRGENYGKNDLAVNIWELAKGKKTWKAISSTLKEPISSFIVGKVNNKIVIAGGKNDEDIYTTNVYVFDGKIVESVKKLSVEGLSSENTVYSGGDRLFIYTDGSSFDFNGIKYDIEKDEWKKFGEKLGYNARTGMFGTVANKQLYIMGGDEDYRLRSKVVAINVDAANEKKSIIKNLSIIAIFTVIFVMGTYYLIRRKDKK